MKQLQVTFEVDIRDRYNWRANGRSKIEIEIDEEALEYIDTGNLLLNLIPNALADYHKNKAESEEGDE